MITKFIGDEGGATAIEYNIIMALILMIIVITTFLVAVNIMNVSPEAIRQACEACDK